MLEAPRGPNRVAVQTAGRPWAFPPKSGHRPDNPHLASVVPPRLAALSVRWDLAVEVGSLLIRAGLVRAGLMGAGGKVRVAVVPTPSSL